MELRPDRGVVLYLIRHGQTTGDVENRYGGSYDDHLTDLGRQQSHSVAFDLLCRGRSNGPVALVTHGGVFRLLFREILKLGETSIDDCALAELYFDEHGLRPVDLRGITIRGR